jgi:hypothetical protein
VLKFPELRPLINNIDWSQWIFRNSNRDGIYEMAKEISDYHGDNFHPGIQTHNAWAQLVTDRLQC